MKGTNTMPLKARFQTSAALPPDEYELVLDSYEEAIIKSGPNAGNTQCKLVFRIVDGDYKGKKVSRYYQVEGDGSYYLFDALEKLGADPEELSPVDADSNPMLDKDGEQVAVDLEPIIKSLYGAHCIGKTGVRSWQGKDMTDLQDIRPLD